MYFTQYLSTPNGYSHHIKDICPLRDIKAGFSMDFMKWGSYNPSRMTLTLSHTADFRLFQAQRVCRRQFQI